MNNRHYSLRSSLNGTQELYEEGQTLIIKDKYGDQKKLKELLKYRKSVDLFWKDVVTIFLDALQIFSLIWICAWKWPIMWKDYSFPVEILNLDIFAIYDYSQLRKPFKAGASTSSSIRSEWGEMKYYLVFACLLMTFLVLLAIYYIYRLFELKARHQNFLYKKRKVQYPLLTILDFLYLPILTCMCRLVICKSSNIREISPYLDCDPSVQCFGTSHIISIIYCIPLTLIYIIGYPILYIILIKKHLVYTTTKEHEIYIMWKEEEYCRNLDNNWSVFWLPLYSSYKRNSVYYRPAVCCLKIFFVIFYTSMRESSEAQSLVLFFIYTLWTIYFTIFTPFRSGVCNYLNCFLSFGNICTLFLGYLKCTNTRNAYLVDNNLTILLVIIWLSILIFGILSMLIFAPLKARWPYPPQPITELGQTQLSNWITTLRQTKKVLYNLEFIPKTLKPIKKLDYLRRNLHEYYLESKRMGHILQYSLREALSDISFAEEECGDESYLKNELFEKEYPQFSERLQERYHQNILIPKRKRQILTKLLALSAFVGNRFLGEDKIIRRKKKRSVLEKEMIQLSNKTKKEISKHDLVLLTKLKSKWKQLLQQWENEFEEKNGRAPTSEDKKVIKEYYKLYKEVINKLKELS